LTEDGVVKLEAETTNDGVEVVAEGIIVADVHVFVDSAARGFDGNAPVGRPGDVHPSDVELRQSVEGFKLVSVEESVVYAAKVAHVVSRPRQPDAGPGNNVNIVGVSVDGVGGFEGRVSPP